MLHPFLEVGALVRHRDQPDWGLGQVQSIIGDRITVNFLETGKVVFVGDAPPLEFVSPDHL
ncbi:MAG: DUF3553 domain-containing protein [Pseudomonadota bacterium]